jgi:acyl carrier protein
MDKTSQVSSMTDPAPQTLDQQTDAILRQLLGDVLGIVPARIAQFGPETGLFGHLPELDSMAVGGLLTEMEDRLGIIIDDDDLEGEMLESYGALLAFAQARRAQG